MRARLMLVLVVLGGTVTFGEEEIRPPSVVMNHLYIVLDQPTFEAVRASKFLTTEFAAVDTGLPRFEPVTADSQSIYLRGEQTYLELFGPENPFGEPVGKVGIGLGVEKAGGIAWVQKQLLSVQPNVTRMLRRWDFDTPKPVNWYDVVYPEHPADTQIVWWVSEYHPDFLPALYPDRPRAETGILRKHFLAPNFRSDRVFKDITALTLRLPEERASRLASDLKALGFKLAIDGNLRVLTGPDLVVRIGLAETGTRDPLQSIDFRANSTNARAGEHRLGQNLWIRFGPEDRGSIEFDRVTSGPLRR